jgi:hypothetical protein
VSKSAKQRVKAQQPEETEILLPDDGTATAEVNDDASNNDSDEDNADFESPAPANDQPTQANYLSVCI